MSKNKSRTMQEAVRVLDMFLALDTADPHALPGSSIGHVKAAKKQLLRDIRKRRDKREREFARRRIE